MFAGRKRDCEVWKWFECNAETEKSVCLAKGLKENSTCGLNLAGNNSTDLKVNSI